MLVFGEYLKLKNTGNLRIPMIRVLFESSDQIQIHYHIGLAFFLILYIHSSYLYFGVV